MGYKSYNANEEAVGGLGHYTPSKERWKTTVGIEPMEAFHTIKVGYKDYALSFPNNLKHADWSGLTDRAANDCQIQDSLDKREKAGTMVHELVHMAFDLCGLSEQYDVSEEEKIVTALSSALSTLMRDNKALFHTIVEDFE